MDIFIYNDYFLYFEDCCIFYSRVTSFILYNINSEIDNSFAEDDELKLELHHIYNFYIIKLLKKNKYHLIFKFFIDKIISNKLHYNLRLTKYDERIYFFKTNKFLIKFPFLLKIYTRLFKRPIDNEYFYL